MGQQRTALEGRRGYAAPGLVAPFASTLHLVERICMVEPFLDLGTSGGTTCQFLFSDIQAASGDFSPI